MNAQVLAEQVLNGLVLGSIYALIAVGYTMVWNILAFINFAHGEVYMAGTFVALTLMAAQGFPLPLAVAGGVVAGALLGVIMEKLAYKPIRKAPKLNLLIAAIGVSIFLQNAAQVIWGASPRPFPSPLLERTFVVKDVSISYHQVFIFVLALVLMLVLDRFLMKTMLGKCTRAVAQDMETAALMGINIDRVVSATFAVGSGLGAVAGILVAPLFLAYPTMGSLAGLKGFTASVLGGMGNLPGAMLGGIILGVLENIAAGFISSGYRDAVAMVILIVLLLFRPSGIFGSPIKERV